MIFSEPRFLLFFLLVFGGYWMLRGNGGRKSWLLAASLFVYDSWDWRVLGLIIGCATLCYIAAASIRRAQERGAGFQGRDAAPDVVQLATVIELDDPNQEPALYDPTLWFDSNHMMKPGAELLTRRLAEKLVAATGR
ncbi:MAG: hypothetical protein R3F29_05885 [Planctomycetota bacterium]